MCMGSSVHRVLDVCRVVFTSTVFVKVGSGICSHFNELLGVGGDRTRLVGGMGNDIVLELGSISDSFVTLNRTLLRFSRGRFGSGEDSVTAIFSETTRGIYVEYGGTSVY